MVENSSGNVNALSEVGYLEGPPAKPRSIGYMNRSMPHLFFHEAQSVDSMSSDETKHVQTELNEDEYERFREFARERGLSVKEAGREALVEWVERQQQPDPHDRAFTVLDELDEESLPESASTNATQESDLVDEWDGSGVTFTLAVDPPAHHEDR